MMDEFVFRFQRAKYVTAQAVRHSWYRSIRAPAGRAVWTLWDRELISDHRVIGRRMGIDNLGDGTLVWLPPERIRRYLAKDDVNRKRFLLAGDWDLRAPDIASHERYQLLNDVWLHRSALGESESYRMFLRMAEEGRAKRIPNKNYFLNSPERILRFLEDQLVLLDSLKEHGIRPEWAPDEMNVAIGRDGEIIKANSGRKRTFGARIAGLPSIPVRVACVHEAWFNRFLKPGTRRSQALAEAVKAAVE